MAGRTLEMVTFPHPARSAVELCDVEGLWDGEMESFGIGELTVLLLKLDGHFHAYQGQCPHQRVDLAEGELVGGIITCRAHGWQFDAADGRGVNPRGICLKRFPVRVQGGKVLIELEDTVMASTAGESGDNFVGPVIRCGEFAEAVAQSIEDDNPGKEVHIVDRGDYVRIHTAQLCRLTRGTLERHLGRPCELRLLELEMPAFSGRLRTRDDEFIWFYET
jgi:nitrite reductase/ring-hydroxylating ferredoxin subunit